MRTMRHTDATPPPTATAGNPEGWPAVAYRADSDLLCQDARSGPRIALQPPRSGSAASNESQLR